MVAPGFFVRTWVVRYNKRHCSVCVADRSSDVRSYIHINIILCVCVFIFTRDCPTPLDTHTLIYVHLYRKRGKRETRRKCEERAR